MAMMRRSLVEINASLLRRLCTPAAACAETTVAASAAELEAAAAGADTAVESAGTRTAVAPAEDPTVSPGTRRLCKRFMDIGSTGRSVADLLIRGHRVGKRGMIRCVAELRKNKRYQHGLEILEWMEKRKYKRCSHTRVLAIDILWKTKGIVEAEKYFGSFSDQEMNKYTYAALLHCHCSEKMADEANKLFEEMVKLDKLSSLAFNSMMNLSLTTGDPEKALDLADEMRRRNLPFDSYTLSILMQSYQLLNDMEGAEKWIDEIEEDGKCSRSSSYIVLASVCIKAGDFVMAEKALRKLEEVSRIDLYCASKHVEV